MKKISIFTMLFFAPIFGAGAGELSFENIWEIVQNNSHNIQSASMETKAAHQAKTRSALNWLPKVYITGSAYQTNDSVGVFMGNLKQRAISNSDFVPDNLNNPDKADFYTGAIGVELPLFEGGAKYREYRANREFLKSAELNEQQIKNQLYASVITQYGSMIVLNQQREQLAKVKDIVDGVSKRYRLNSAQNPMGKSGALGIKSLQNRLEIMLMQNGERQNSIREILSQQGVNDSDWMPSDISIQDLLSEKVNADLESESFGLASAKSGADGMMQNAYSAGAAHLPYVAAFAQNDIFGGDRDTSNGYTVGLSLKWSLYDPSTHGIENEARLKAASAKEKVMEMQQQENANRKSLQSQIVSAEKSVKLMNESYEMMVKSTIETSKLFKNGAINVLQWLDVISRRADVIENMINTKLGLLQLNAYSITSSGFKL